MWPIILIVGSIAGLIYIFFKKYKETKRLERVKVKAQKRERRTLNTQLDNVKGLAWKKKSLDYKSIHEAYNKADLFFDKGEIDEAQKCFIQVLSLHPDHEEANNKLGLIYIQKKMPAKAEAIFRRLIDINPMNPEFFSNLGLALFDQDHMEEALEAYLKAISLSPRSVKLYCKLGEVYKNIGKVMAAVNAYSKALEIDSKNYDLYFTACDLLLELKAYPEAIAYLEALLEIQPYNTDAKDKITQIKIKMGANPLSGSMNKQVPAQDDQPELFG